MTSRTTWALMIIGLIIFWALLIAFAFALGFALARLAGLSP